MCMNYPKIILLFEKTLWEVLYYFGLLAAKWLYLCVAWPVLNLYISAHTSDKMRANNEMYTKRFHC